MPIITLFELAVDVKRASARVLSRKIVPRIIVPLISTLPASAPNAASAIPPPITPPSPPSFGFCSMTIPARSRQTQTSITYRNPMRIDILLFSFQKKTWHIILELEHLCKRGGLPAMSGGEIEETLPVIRHEIVPALAQVERYRPILQILAHGREAVRRHKAFLAV